MPLTKAQKLLYEAALRRKGLQPGKAVRQDPRTFVGPIRTIRGSVRSPYYHPEYRTQPDVFQMPADTYWTGRGRLQDLEDERLALDAMRTMGDQKRANAKLYIDTLHNNGYNRVRR